MWMRKVILYIAISLDGYVADNNGSVDWLGGVDVDYAGDYGYDDFITNVDTVVMGGRTYRQVVQELSPDVWPYAGLQSYVLTRQPLPDKNEIHFVTQSPVQLVERLRHQSGKDIWICGGAEIAQQLMVHNLIDEYDLSVMPCLLGDGVRLFGKMPSLQLDLISANAENGVVRYQYKRRCAE